MFLSCLYDKEPHVAEEVSITFEIKYYNAYTDTILLYFYLK